jgi:hypothetical protein
MARARTAGRTEVREFVAHEAVPVDSLLSVVGSDPFRVFAAAFLSCVERGDWSADMEGFYEDPRTKTLGCALSGIGLGAPDRILGAGSFGVAASLIEHSDRVIKLTADRAELDVSAYLLKEHTQDWPAHVARIFNVWQVSGVQVDAPSGWDAKSEEVAYSKVPAGIIVVEKLDRSPEVLETLRDSGLSHIVREAKEKAGVTWEDLTKLPKTKLRDRLEKGSVVMQKALYAADNEVCSDVAQAVEELYGLGVYAVDVHAGNVGYNESKQCFQVFDIGVGSGPAKTKPARLSFTQASPRGVLLKKETAIEANEAPLSAVAVATTAPCPTVTQPAGDPPHVHQLVAQEAAESGLVWQQRPDGAWQARGMGGMYYALPRVSGVTAVWVGTAGDQVPLGDYENLAGAFGAARRFMPEKTSSKAAEVVPVLHESAASESLAAEEVRDGVPWFHPARDPKQHAAMTKTADKIGKIDTPKQVYDLVGPYLAKQDQEVFLVIPLDIHGKLRAGVVEVARGQRARVQVATADIMRAVLDTGASSFIVVHNHPTGRAKPSEADKELTKAIKNAAALFRPDVKFDDHVIAGNGELYSFEHGGLQKVK